MKLSSAERQAVQKLRDWKADPILFVRENFQVTLDPWAERALVEVAKPGKKRVALQGAVGVAKSTTLAMAGWHFLSTNADAIRHPGKYPNGYALSISGENLASGLWKELAVWRSRSPFLQREFEWTAEKVFQRENPGTWWLKARTFSKSANPEQQGAVLSGLHSPWTMVLLDECGGMPPIIGRRAEQVLSEKECEVGVVFAAGNPTDVTGLLYDIASREAGWTVMVVTGDPDDPNRSSRVDIEWARDQINQYGRENPWVMAHILGKFPPGGLNTLLTPDEVRAAMARNPQTHEYEWSQKRLGIDVARFGDDRTVIFPRQGLLASMPVVLRQQDTNAIASRVLVAVHRWGSEAEFIDDTGHWGHGVVDNLIASGRPAQPVIFSDPAINPRYANRRAEMLFESSEWVKRGGCLPNVPDLVHEMSQVTYGLSLTGKIFAEEKAQVKKRIGSSPDLFDALALTFAIPDQPGLGGLSPEVAALVHQGIGTGHIVRDWDPFDESRMRG